MWISGNGYNTFIFTEVSFSTSNKILISGTSLTQVTHRVATLHRASPSFDRRQPVDSVPDRRQDGPRLPLPLNDARRDDDVGVGVGIGELLAGHVTAFPDTTSYWKKAFVRPINYILNILGSQRF